MEVELMSLMSPETAFGSALEIVDKKGDKDDIFNLRLMDGVSDEDKEAFESYAMIAMGGDYFLKEMFPKMKDPYYTWEGKVVERATLKGRKPAPVKAPKDGEQILY